MLHDYGRRLVWLLTGIAVSSIGIVLMLQANVGLEPWSVLQQGMTLVLPITYGVASIIAGAAAIGLAIVFGESFGLGTIVNIIGCGVCIDAMLALDWVPQLHSLPGGIVMLLAGQALLALGTWMYMRSALGAGPRDALMVALARKSGRSAGFCRVCVDILVTVSGFFLGGQFGIGTIIAALGLGSLINLNFNLLHFHPAEVHQENIAESLRRFGGYKYISAPSAGFFTADGAFFRSEAPPRELSLAKTAKTRDNRRKNPLEHKIKKPHTKSSDRRAAARI